MRNSVLLLLHPTSLNLMSNNLCWLLSTCICSWPSAGRPLYIYIYMGLNIVVAGR